MGFPIHRPRRLRKNEGLRKLVRESSLSLDNIVLPMFVVPGYDISEEIEAIPGTFHLSVDRLVEQAKQIRDAGIPAVLLFGVPEQRDDMASGAYAETGIVQTAIRALKNNVSDLVVITDVCMCEYTPHGHCGVMTSGSVDNDRTLELIARTALSHVEAGADIVAPASMMDGQVRAMRSILDGHGHAEAVIMGYSAKFASRLYDPFFQHGSKSVVQFADKRTYQMDFANSNEALREIELDIGEGVDIIMVKPGMFYLDIIWRAKQRFEMPLAVYNVSGEYAMIKAAAEAGRLDERAVMMEVLAGFRRAGADIIITYFARQVAEMLNSPERHLAQVVDHTEWQPVQA